MSELGRLKVLLVEDHLSTGNEFLSILRQDLNCDARLADTLVDAWSIYLSWYPKLIILDVNFPQQSVDNRPSAWTDDGDTSESLKPFSTLLFCKRVKEDGREIPVYILSSSDSKYHREKAFEAGADDYYLKKEEPRAVVNVDGKDLVSDFYVLRYIISNHITNMKDK